MSLRTNSSGLTYWVTKPEYNAECADCDWRSLWTKTGLALGANHHRKTGHTVHVAVESVIQYETPEAYELRMNGDPNQLTIEGGS